MKLLNIPNRWLVFSIVPADMIRLAEEVDRRGIDRADLSEVRKVWKGIMPLAHD